MNAVTQNGSSLLPKGITEVSATFKRGDVIQLQSLQGKLLGRGICRYTSDELATIAGCHSCDIESKLGYGYGAVAIHRDDLVLF